MFRLLSILTLALIAASPATRLATALDAFGRHHDREAAAELRALAYENSAVAETLLGVMYADGRIGRADPATAAAYWLRAAQRGYPPAQIALARTLADGRGMPRNRAQAYTWALIAARLGEGATRAEASGLAASLRVGLEERDVRDRIARAADWRPWPAGT